MQSDYDNNNNNNSEICGVVPVVDDGEVTAAPISFTFADDQQVVEPTTVATVAVKSSSSSSPQSEDCANTGVVAAADGIILRGASKGTAAAAVNTHTRPGTPPPRSLLLFTPTKINPASRRRLISNGSSGDDEVHPLMPSLTIAASASSTLEDGQLANKNKHNNTQSLELHNLHKTNDSSNKNKNKNNNKNDKQINFKQRLAMENFLAAQSSNHTMAKEEAWRELVRAMKQQTEENNSIFHRGQNHAARSNSNHPRRQQGSGAAASGRSSIRKGKNDILGLIRIGGGMKIGAGSSDVVSIASGLTTEHYETATTNSTMAPATAAAAANTANAADGNANSNLHVSPQHEEWKRTSRPYAEKEPDRCSHQHTRARTLPPPPQLQDVTTEDRVLESPSTPGKLVRSVTPPSTFSSSGMILSNNILTTAGGLPTVSPLSVDGILSDDIDDDDEYNDRLDNTAEKDGSGNGMAENDISLKFPMMDDSRNKYSEEKEKADNKQGTATKKKSSSSALFFDIGESFADNAKRLWNKDPINNSINNDDDNANVVSSLVDSMSEEGESTTRSGSEDKSMMKRWHQQPPPLLLPLLRKGSSSVSMFHLPASQSSHGGSISSDGGFEKMSLWESEMLRQVGVSLGSGSSKSIAPKTGPFSLIAHSNEGEIVSFRESEGYSPIAALEQHDTHQSIPSHSPRQRLSPRKEPNSVENGQNSFARQRSSKRRSKRQGGGGGNKNIIAAQSLEEQILTVLQQQPESFVVGDIVGEELGGALDSSANIKSSPVMNGTVGSAASAQDILRELRISMSDTLHIDKSLNYSCNRSSNKSPLGSISIGMRGLHLGPDGSKEATASRQLSVCFSSEDDLEERNDLLTPTPTLTLNPSPRDIPRPSRCRKSVSDSTPVTSALKVLVSATSPRISMVTNTSPYDKKPPTPGLRGANANSSDFNSNTMRPLERYCNAIGTNTQHVSVKSSLLRGRIFPYTSPVTSEMTGGSSTMQSVRPFKSTYPFDAPSTNSHDSPPRILPSQRAKEPFVEQSSPIPMERSGDTDISQDASAYSSEGGVILHGNSYDTPMSTPSESSVLKLKPSKLDTIRARRSPPPPGVSHNFPTKNRQPSVLHGNATSALVHNEGICRFRNRVVVDDRLVDEDESNVEEEKVWVAEASRNGYVNDADSPSLLKSTPRYQLREEWANAIMDDDVVEDAVRACLSTTSTSSIDVSTMDEVVQAQRQAAGENEDWDEFLVISPVNWSAFDDPNVGNLDDFEILPSKSMDDWGDDNRWGFDEDGQIEKMNKENKVYFSSPTSVATGRRVA